MWLWFPWCAQALVYGRDLPVGRDVDMCSSGGWLFTGLLLEEVTCYGSWGIRGFRWMGVAGGKTCIDAGGT